MKAAGVQNMNRRDFLKAAVAGPAAFAMRWGAASAFAKASADKSAPLQRRATHPASGTPPREGIY